MSELQSQKGNRILHETKKTQEKDCTTNNSHHCAPRTSQKKQQELNQMTTNRVQQQKINITVH